MRGATWRGAADEGSSRDEGGGRDEGSSRDEEGDTDVGVAWMRGTTEGGSMDEAAAQTRRQHG